MRKVGSMAGNLAGLKKGDVILVGNDRRYKIVKMVSFTEAKVRRTFGQWLKDLWASLAQLL